MTSLYTSVSDRVWSEYQALAKKGRLEYVNPLNMKEIWKRTGLYHQPFDCGRNKKNALLTFLASKSIGCLFEEIIQGIFQKNYQTYFAENVQWIRASWHDWREDPDCTLHPGDIIISFVSKMEWSYWKRNRLTNIDKLEEKIWQSNIDTLKRKHTEQYRATNIVKWKK